MFIALIEKIRYLSVFLSILYLTFFIKKKTVKLKIDWQFFSEWSIILRPSCT